VRSVCLASSSPRRRELLSRLGITFDVVNPAVNETALTDEDPRSYVKRCASAKANAVTSHPVTLGADTIVVHEGSILTKPQDRPSAMEMLRRLSGSTHQVMTALTVRSEQSERDALCESAVTFSPLSESMIDWYLGLGEWTDKAGAYAIQGAGDVFVSNVSGSVSNVIGLPLRHTARLMGAALRDADIDSTGLEVFLDD
jgi:septum formation protein